MTLTKTHNRMIDGAYSSAKDFGDFTTPAERTSALLAALSADNAVFVNEGVYDPVDITVSNKTLIMDEGVEFKLPNGTYISSDVVGNAVFQVSGSNVSIRNDFTVNGNRANNDSTSFPTTVKTGTVNISGDNCRISGQVKIIDAYYRGFSVDGGNNSGDEVDRFYAKAIYVEDPNYYATHIWSVKNWHIEELVVLGGTPGAGRDQRIRTGTQNSSTAECLDGQIDYIHATNYVGLIIEARTSGLQIGTANVENGGKFEDCFGCSIDLLNINKFNAVDQVYGWSWNNCEFCRVDNLIVENYNCDPAFNGRAVAVGDAVQCSAGSIVVKGTIANKTDVYIVRPDGFYANSISCINPVGTGDGLHYDAEVSVTQRDIVINSITSRGHTTYDVIIEGTGEFFVNKINPDAVVTSPNNDTSYEEGDWTPTYVTSGTDFDAVTYHANTAGKYVKNGSIVTVTGTILTSAITVGAGTGTVNIGGLPFTAVDDYGARSVMSLSRVSAFTGDNPLTGYINYNTDVVILYYRSAVNGDDTLLAIADLNTGAGNDMSFSMTYQV
jgi:hypothetical protein